MGVKVSRAIRLSSVHRHPALAKEGKGCQTVVEIKSDAGNLPYRAMRCAFYKNVTYFLTFPQVVATVTALVTVGFSYVGQLHHRSTKSRGGAKRGFALMEGATVRKALAEATHPGAHLRPHQHWEVREPAG
jgi:hypothetical protein